MNIKATGELLIQKYRNFKINKKEAQIAKLVDLKDVHQKDIQNVLYDAREVLANYARAKNVSIPQANKLLQVSVCGKNNHPQVNIINFAEPIKVHTTPQKIEYGNPYTHDCIYKCEDNFLRSVYRLIGEMTSRIVK